jgi:hypothetical protein
MNADDKLKGVIRKVARARGHNLGPWRLKPVFRGKMHAHFPIATCRNCGMVFNGPGLDVRTIPQCPQLFPEGKEG